MSKEKLTKIDLKLRKPHPRQVMRLGSHSVTAVFAPYELNSAELKELHGKGCKAEGIREVNDERIP